MSLHHIHPIYSEKKEGTYASGKGKTITEVADVVTLWTNLRADIQLNVDIRTKRNRLEVSGFGTSITNSNEYFSLFTVSSTRQGSHYLIKTNYKKTYSGELSLCNTHTYNIVNYTYENQKLQMTIESYNDVQGLITGQIILEPPTKINSTRSFHI
jgi:uncharacterized protein (UPF0276 family)